MSSLTPYVISSQTTPRRFADAPRDRPQDRPRSERLEHGNLDRPGAKSHPRAAPGRKPGLAH